MGSQIELVGTPRNAQSSQIEPARKPGAARSSHSRPDRPSKGARGSQIEPVEARSSQPGRARALRRQPARVPERWQPARVPARQAGQLDKPRRAFSIWIDSIETCRHRWEGRATAPPSNPPGLRFFLAAAVSDPDRTPNEPRTPLKRIPNGPERTPRRSRTDPERTSRGPRADFVQIPNGPQMDPERTLGHQNLLPHAVTD